jgi:isoquinoline 1-oxidoreductase beta subunit
MNAHSAIRPSRRAFLAGSAGLVIGLYLPRVGRAEAAAPDALRADAAGLAGQFAPNAFVRIAPDDLVTVLSKHLEMGQGPYSGLAAIVAEELDADWSQMRAEAAPADVDKYKNLAFGMQGTGGSTAIANSYEQLRMAGATARALLVAAAAQAWGVPAAEISVERGRVRHAVSGKESGFGALAGVAATLPSPHDVTLKDPKDFRLIGTDLPRLDMQAKSTGKAMFTLDVRLPDMVVALVAHPAQFGATVASFDDTATRAVKGVLDVKQVPQGVAVYAENSWAAIKGRAELKIAWDTSKAELRPTAQIIAEYSEAAKEPGLPVAAKGDLDTVFAGAAPTLQADFVFPYLAHAPMEPLDAVIVKAEDGGIDVFMGSQMQTMDQQVVAGTLGVPPETVRINTLFAGGSFGRRAQPGSPYTAEAAAVFKAFGGARPVKHFWTREDDIRGGYYRPIYVHRLKGWLEDGAIAGWDQTIVGQSIMAGTPFEAMMKDGVDPTSVEGARDLPYSIPNHRVTVHNMKTGVPVLWWRSVGSTHTGFTTETFVDELLAALGKDPVEGRLALLGDSPRHAGVLRRVAEMADWGATPSDGRMRGVALHKSFDTYVAEVAEVSVGPDGMPKVHKVWCAVDCGVPVTPNVIRAQMEGGIGYGLGAVLFNELTLGEEGRIVQSNFHDYRSIRIGEMPDIEVDVIRSTEAPTGVGEPGVPPIGPAVANAWRQLTKEPVRRLPIRSVAGA